MTIHINNSHKCPSCDAFYIPYDEDVPCPKCGKIEKENFDFFMPLALESLMFNKKQGSFIPPMWYVSSFGDHVLHLLFPIFEAYGAKKPGNFRRFAAKRLSKLDWGKQKYLEKHLLEIAVRLEKKIRNKI
jgi:hypothetical protein